MADLAKSTEDLLARLPDIKRPMLQSEQVIQRVAAGDADHLPGILSGRFLDDLLPEIVGELPDVQHHIAGLGPAGLTLQARPSNTVNALMIPTPDGVVIIYNLGLFGMLFTVAKAVAFAAVSGEVTAAAAWLSDMVDWATSRAQEPRYTGNLDLDEEFTALAANVASRAQRFVLCHELAHVITFDRTRTPKRRTTVDGVAVDAIKDSWDREFAADRDGLSMYVQVLERQGGSAASALVGAELFMNAADLLQEFSQDESDSHPPADARIARLRDAFAELRGAAAAAEAAPSQALRQIMDLLRPAVLADVRRRRAETRAGFETSLARYAARAPGMSQDDMRAAARDLSRYLLKSPGATLACLHESIFAPLGLDEPSSGGPARLLALHAALHLEKPLQESIELDRLRFGD